MIESISRFLLVEAPYVIPTLLSLLAITISLLALWLSRSRARIASYLSMERDANTQAFSLLVEKDFLNKLFYNDPDDILPDDGITLEKMTGEQRAILNFGAIILGNFELITRLEYEKSLPPGIFVTWRQWITECADAPYFCWVWRKLRGHYHKTLQDLIDREIESGKSRQSSTKDVSEGSRD